MTKKANGKTFFLSKEERLELANVRLRRQVLEVQLGQRINELEAEQENLVQGINKRLGIDLKDWRINLDTGEISSLDTKEPGPVEQETK